MWTSTHRLFSRLLMVQRVFPTLSTRKSCGRIHSEARPLTPELGRHIIGADQEGVVRMTAKRRSHSRQAGLRGPRGRRGAAAPPGRPQTEPSSDWRSKSRKSPAVFPSESPMSCTWRIRSRGGCTGE
jgi:hypothetical protein